MKHVYLSPHLDDAVLSCGGAIHHHAAAGEKVLAITIFAGEFEGADPPPFALVQHGYWGNPPRPMALRRAEDMAALTLLGAAALHLDYLDAVYRADPSGLWMYTDLDTLLGEVHPGDPIYHDGAVGLADRLASLISPQAASLIYAPLGAGRHVDHQLVHLTARNLLGKGYRVVFYEDYPYAVQPGALETALADANAGSWQFGAIPLDAADLTAKVSAVGYYRTQMGVLFGSAETMPSRVWAFAASRSPERGLSEPLWWPPEV